MNLTTEDEALRARLDALKPYFSRAFNAFNGPHIEFDFKTGWGASIIQGPAGFELAVMRNGELHYANPVAYGDNCHGNLADVVGWLETIQAWGDHENFLEG